MASNCAGVGIASQQIGLHEVEQLVVIKQFVEAGEFGLELKLEFGDQLEEVHGIVSIDYHGCSALVEVFGHKNPTGAAYFAPQTIYVEGAEPGDTLAIHIESIEPTRDFAVSVLIPYFGGLTSTTLTRTLQEPLPERVWIWNLVDGGDTLVNEVLGVELAWEPFLGTLAVAPDLEAITALAPGPFGGNMDVPDVKPGNTVYLPVWNSGALVYTGDCHARQGQGELCGVALEITSKVTMVFEVIKDKAIEWPRIESDEAIMVVGSARPMEDAARIANTELIL